MPPTATLEEIKTYQEKVDKNEITPHNLPPCPLCDLDSRHFKNHAYRERRFLIIVEMIVKSAFCTLVRFKCTGCKKKTFTYYPDFALPHKHYTRQTITGLAGEYVDEKDKTYAETVMVDNTVPGYSETEKDLSFETIRPESGKTLAASTVHRWISSLSRLEATTREGLNLVLQENPCSRVHRDLAQMSIPVQKYRSDKRKNLLLRCRRMLLVETFFQSTFKISLFTKLALRYAFG